jgi:hypothetical protein
MSKHISPSYFYELPSGAKVHPCRLILKDGSLMWKHALFCNNNAALPECEAHEQHIIKTAQRLEELNSWVSQDLEPWNFLVPSLWYVPALPDYAEGISVNFTHSTKDTAEVYDILCNHVLAHETLNLRDKYIYFKRC